MHLGEVVFGGVGSGRYDVLVFAIIAMFVAGLMVGRTPEFYGKKIEQHEMKMATIIILIPIVLILAFTSLAVLTTAGQACVFNPGPHGFTEILYAYTSAAQNNGSAFAGLSADNLPLIISRQRSRCLSGASENDGTARTVQGLFHRPEFRIYRSTDILGVEYGGALKNIIAIGAGVSDGLGYGDNTKAGLVTRALSEMRRLGVACGAQSETFAGLSGLGDLMLTCFSKQSRNRDLGERLGRGETMAAIQASHPKLAEGYPTARSATDWRKRRKSPRRSLTRFMHCFTKGRSRSGRCAI